MANLPTPEQTAQEILAIFVRHFECRPGNVLKISNFLAVWGKRGLHEDDLEPGMKFAAQQGWVEILEGRDSFRLTDAGFSEA